MSQPHHHQACVRGGPLRTTVSGKRGEVLCMPLDDVSSGSPEDNAANAADARIDGHREAECERRRNDA